MRSGDETSDKYSPTLTQEIVPNTFAIIDGSEIFLEMASDLCIQSSTWSQYKHHNTAKFLVACTPSGAVSPDGC